MSDIKPQFKGNIGIFLVCAELSKLNLIAMPTSRNTKGYDIMIMNPKSNKAIGIQVKCTDRKDYPILSSYLKDYEKEIQEKIICDFVFVDISDSKNPGYYILSVNEMRELMKSRVKKYANEYGKRNTLSWEGILGKEEAEKRKPNLWALKLAYISEFGGRWETITDKLR